MMLKNNIEITPINKQFMDLFANIKQQPLIISIIGAGGKTHLVYWLAKLFKSQGHCVGISTTTKMYLPEKHLFDRFISLGCDSKQKQSLDNRLDKKGLISLMSGHRAGNNTSTQQNNTLLPPSTTFIYQNNIMSTNEPTKAQGLSLYQLEKIAKTKLFSVLIVEADGARKQPIKAPDHNEPCIPKYSQVVFAVTGADAIFCKADRHKIHRWEQFSALTQCHEKMPISKPVLARLIASPQGMFKGSPSDALNFWVINKYDLCTDKQNLLQLSTQLLNEQSILNGVCLTQLNSDTSIKNLLIKNDDKG